MGKTKEDWAKELKKLESSETMFPRCTCGHGVSFHIDFGVCHGGAYGLCACQAYEGPK